MNKSFLVLGLFAGGLLLAQETKEVTPVSINKEKEPVRFGIKGGANATQFSEQRVDAKNQKIGFNAGVFVNIPLSQKFAIQPEVLYNQMGAKSLIDYSEFASGSTKTIEETNSTVYLNYISVPLLLQLKPADNFYIEAGPEFSYFLDGKNKNTTTITKTTGNSTETKVASESDTIDKDSVKKFNIGMALGLGYYFTKNLGINARYVNGFNHIANNSGVDKADKDINTNRVFQIGLNYKF